MRKLIFTSSIYAVVLVGMVAAPTPAGAQAERNAGGNHNEDLLAQEIIDAKAELDAARLVVAQAESAVESNERVLIAEMRHSPEYRELVIRVQRARVRYELTQRPILELLRQDDEYARLRNEQTSARKMIEDLVEDQRASFLELLPHAKKALEAGRKMRREEIIALALDPEVENARQEWVTQNNLLRAMNGAFRDQARRSDAVRIAGMDLEAARARVESAEDRLAQALARYNERERLRQERSRNRPGPEAPPTARPNDSD